MIAARREPLIWLQLLSAAALPLEVLLVLLLLAGADPGPVPGLERLLAWGIGALAPAVLLWKRPADPFSLLLVQAPLRARTPAQGTLSAGPLLLPRLAGAAGAALLLPALWWIDGAAALAGPMALLPDANRLVALLVTVPVLAVMVWQLQQLVQTIALLLRSPNAWTGLAPLTPEQIETQRLCVGLPLLLLEPLTNPEPVSKPAVSSRPAPPVAEAKPEPAPSPEPTQEPSEPIEVEAEAPQLERSETEPAEEEPSEPEPSESTPADAEAVPVEAEAAPAETEAPSVADVGVAVDPEQPAEDHDSTDLNQKID